MHHFLRILIRGLGQAILVALFVSTLCFAMLRVLPGDMAYRIAAGRYGYDLTTGAGAERVRAELGLDRPALDAWLSWMNSLLHFDFGVSFITGRTVWYELSLGIGHTLELAIVAFVTSVVIGVPFGVLAALRPQSWLDRLVLLASVILRSTPPFLIGLLLVLALAVQTQILPAGGDTETGALILPAMVLACGLSAVSMQVTRTAMLEVLGSDYFAFARMKGLPPFRTVMRHGLRNAAVPVVSYLGYQLVYLIEGVVVVETIFAWPGIGHGLVHAITGRDVPIVQGTALVMGLLFVAMNMLIDLANLVIDPRLRAR